MADISIHDQCAALTPSVQDEGDTAASEASYRERGFPESLRAAHRLCASCPCGAARSGLGRARRKASDAAFGETDAAGEEETAGEFFPLPLRERAASTFSASRVRGIACPTKDPSPGSLSLRSSASDLSHKGER